jgi:competence ComEA-like helix-hairpin-helix protein
MNIKDYFSFTRGEKRGNVVILLIIACLITANFSLDFLKTSHQTDFSEFEKEISEFEKERNTVNSISQVETVKLELFEFDPNTIPDEEWKKLGFKDWQIKTINNYKAKGGRWKSKADVKKIYGLDEKHYKQFKPYILLPDKKEKAPNNNYSNEITYFNFNPNTISIGQWKKLGFKDWQIKTIFNYKAKGGSWKTKSDVKKIYGLDETDYHKLEPYILLPEEDSTNNIANKEDYTIKININTADAKELTKLKGINSEKYAAIIIKYRNKLGGFIKKDQLKEVWSLDEETYNGFINQIELGNSSPKKININKALAKELTTHPYINWNIANAIVKYRKTNGNFENLEDVKKIHLINDEIYLKISPYLNIK